MREWSRSSSPLLIGQSLELWSGMSRQAFARRAPAALVRQARGQLDAGAQAIDVNLGVDDPGEHLGWVASALRDALPETPLFLDCGDVDALVAVLPAVAPPLVANAAPLDAGAEVVVEAAAAAGAGVVLSPRAADADDPAPLPRLLELADEGRALAARSGVTGGLYFDCLAYPAASDGERCLRSLDLVRALRERRPALAPLVAVGNVAHGAPAPLRALLGTCYAAAAVGAGARALILPVEDAPLLRAVALADGSASPEDGAERWLVELADAAAAGRALPAPAPDVASGAGAVWALLAGDGGA